MSTRPFRLTEEPVPEDRLHASVAKALTFLLPPPVMWTTFPAGNIPLAPQFAAKLARLGLARGWPDILILHGGALYGIELKRRDGKLSRTRTVRTLRGSLRTVPGQADVFPLLEAAGMTIAVCHNIDDVIDQCQAWSLPMRLAA